MGANHDMRQKKEPLLGPSLRAGEGISGLRVRDFGQGGARSSPAAKAAGDEVRSTHDRYASFLTANGRTHPSCNICCRSHRNIGRIAKGGYGSGVGQTCFRNSRC